jgi:hypothetical protein
MDLKPSMDPKTIAIGGAVLVGAVGLFLMSRSGQDPGEDDKKKRDEELGVAGLKSAAGLAGVVADPAADWLLNATGQTEKNEKLIKEATEHRQELYKDALAQIDVPNLSQARSDVVQIAHYNATIAKLISIYVIGTPPKDPLAGNKFVEELTAKIEAKAAELDVPRMPILNKTIETTKQQLDTADKLLKKGPALTAPEDRQTSASLTTAKQAGLDLVSNKAGVENTTNYTTSISTGLDAINKATLGSVKQFQLDEAHMQILAAELLHTNDPAEFERKRQKYTDEWAGTGVGAGLIGAVPGYRVLYMPVREVLSMGNLAMRGIPSKDTITKVNTAYVNGLNLPSWVMSDSEKDQIKQAKQYCSLFDKK